MSSGYPEKWYGFGVERSKGQSCRSQGNVIECIFHANDYFIYVNAHLTDNSNTAWFSNSFLNVLYACFCFVLTFLNLGCQWGSGCMLLHRCCSYLKSFMSVGLGGIFESVCFSFVCLSVCLFVRSTIHKQMIPKCSNLVQEMTFGYTRSDIWFGGKKVKGQGHTANNTTQSHFISNYNRASSTFARWRYWRATRRGFELYECILVQPVRSAAQRT